MFLRSMVPLSFSFPNTCCSDFILHDLPVNFVQLIGHAVDLHTQHRRRLIHQIDGLVRKEAIGYIPLDRTAQAIMALSVIRTPWWISNRSFRPRRMDMVSSTVEADRRGTVWNASFQSSILFNIFPVFIQCCGADAVQLATGPAWASGCFRHPWRLRPYRRRQWYAVHR